MTTFTTREININTGSGHRVQPPRRKRHVLEDSEKDSRGTLDL